MSALFAGTFNPPTLGHLDIIQRAHTLFTKLYVAVGKSDKKEKNNGFSQDQSRKLVQKLTSAYSNVEVLTFEGLVVDLARKLKVDCLVRGLRVSGDFEYESSMAYANRKLASIETLFLMADESKAHISSSLIREIATHGGSLKPFIPEAIENEVALHFLNVGHS